jgi:hypothetical protein
MASHVLKVEGEQTDELFVIDSRFALVQRAVARLEVTLPAGVYKVKLRRAREEIEKIIILDRDQTVPLTPPAFASPAPFTNSSRTHETHIEAAQRESQNVHITVGIGSRIFLMSRYWTAPVAARAERPNPARGLSLHRLNGKAILDLGDVAVLGDQHNDAWAACAVSVEPGTYLLRQQMAGGMTIERTLVASPDWQTQVFILKNEHRRGDGQGGALPDAARAALPDTASVFMSRGGFDPGRADMELAETARIALADERRIVSEQLLPLLAGKFDNPMLGIFGAHILLMCLDRAEADASRPAETSPSAASVVPRLDLELDPEDLDTIVRNLRSLVGNGHPDVEALSLRAVDGSLRHRKPLREPPMLRRSWSLFVAASNDAPRLVPPELWTTVRFMTASPPWFTWLRSPSGKDPAQSLVKVAARIGPAPARDRSIVALTVKEKQARLKELAARHKVRIRGQVAMKRNAETEIVGPVAAAPPDKVRQAGRTVPPTKTSVRQRLDPDVRRRLSLENDVPRSVLDRAIRRR